MIFLFQTIVCIKFKKDIRSLLLNTVAKFIVLNKMFEISIGFSENVEQFDFTSGAIYGPVFMNKFNIGVGLTNHCLSYSTNFLKNDFFVIISRWNDFNTKIFLKIEL